MATSIAHYNILEPMGAGGIGDVFRARDTKAGRTVALKIVDPRLAGDPQTLARLLEDAAAAARLSHPNIATLWDVGEADGQTYLAYEFVAGNRLRDEFGGVAMPARRALDIAIQIADGVSDAHANGVIHGDLRPDTVMVTGKGSAKILDFGMARWTRGGALRDRAAAESDTMPAEAVSILAYLSPEQALGGAVDARTDVFSVAVITYELVTGMNPFASATASQTMLKVIRSHVAAPSDVNPAVPKDSDVVLSRALAPDLTARQQSAAALAAELRTVAAILDVRTGDTTAPSALLPIDVTPDRNAAGVLTAALVAAAAAAGAMWWWLAR